MRKKFARDPRFTAQAIERRVFDALAPTINWQAVPGSIQQPLPPQPDLLCDLVGEGPVAIEFVSIDAESIRLRTSNTFSTPTAWDRALDMRSTGEQQRLRATLNDAYIAAEFRDEAPLGTRMMALSLLQSFLLGHLGRRGEVTAGHLGFPEGFVKVTIWRDDFTDGPHIRSSSGGYYQGPQVQNITDHLQTTYQTDGRPLDLFAYATHDDPDGHVDSLNTIKATVAAGA